MRRIAAAVAIFWSMSVSLAAAGPSPVGQWKTVDDKTGQVESVVEIYDQGGKLFGKIVALTDPIGPTGQPKICVQCPGADKDKPVVGLVILRDLAPRGDKFSGGTIMDPKDGKVYKAEIWVDDGKLKVRGYVGLFYRTQTWLKAT